MEGEDAGPSRTGAYQWAELMRRTCGLDVLACPRCGGRLRLVALIDQASVVQRILRHLGLPTEVPEPRPARAPPRPLETLEDQSQALLNSMPPGEGVASCEEGCPCVASFPFPAGHFPVAFPPMWP